MSEPKIWMNGKLTPQAEAVLPVNSAAVFYATNVFEGLRAYWNETDGELYCFRLAEHFARFRESMKMMRFTIPYSDADLTAAVKEVLAGNNLREAPFVVRADPGLDLGRGTILSGLQPVEPAAKTLPVGQEGFDLLR